MAVVQSHLSSLRSSSLPRRSARLSATPWLGAAALTASLGVIATPGWAAEPGAEPAPAPAPAPTDADGWFRQGNEAYQANDFASAERCYAKAWELKRSFDIAGNYGQTLFKLGKMGKAAEVLGYTVANFPPTADADRRARVEQMLAEAKAKVGVVALVVRPETATVRLDGAPLGAPLPTELFLDPGPHVLEAAAPGHGTAKQELDAVAGGSQPVRLVLVPEPAAPAAGAAEGSNAELVPYVAGIGYGVGGAGLVAAIVLTAMANGKASAFSDKAASIDAQAKSCPEGSTDADCVALRDSWDARNSLSNAAMGVWIGTGVVLLGTSIATAVLALSGGDTSASDSGGSGAESQGPAVTFAPALTPTGAALGVVGRF